MIEKMKFLSITGHKDDIDRITGQYLSKYEIHLENALTELKTVKNLRPYLEINPYKETYLRSQEMMSSLNGVLPRSGSDASISVEKAIQIIEELDVKLTEQKNEKESLETRLDTLRESLKKIQPFIGLEFDLSKILHFKYVRFRFGRIAEEYFDKFNQYVYDSLDTVFYSCSHQNNYVWGVYFVPDADADRIDAIYASMHFERFFVPDDYQGTPQEAVSYLEQQISEAAESLDSLRAEIAQTLEDHKQELADANAKLSSLSSNFNIRKLAACTKQDINTFYILCGWMTERDAAAFQKDIDDDELIYCIVEDDHTNITCTPPTKLKNPKIFKPFEMFIQMYGLPAYNEIDPTMLVGITYSILFGFMFGDVGQGLCLLVGGLLLYRFRRMNLAAIVSCCGFFSTIFGFLFGSVFGFENIIDPLWLRPAEQMTMLPFIGKLNTVFIVAIAIGMGIILMTMVLNIVNSIRSKDTEKTYFDTNGVAGLVFYGAAAVTIVLYMTGNPIPGTVLLIVMFGLPLVAIFFKEQLTALLTKKAAKSESGKVMFVVQGFFELFEVLLSYFSNTLSFVRVGAFAVSHAAMMEVVLMLAGAEAGSPNWLVIVLGNLFVCGMEGLIVGIQVLRLEYYELFSRFYRGTGREFVPYGKSATTSK